MKKTTITKLLFTSCALLFISSNIYAENAESDSYEDETPVVAEETSTTDIAAADEYIEEGETKNSKKSDNSDSSFFSFGNKGKYITIDESSVYYKNMIGKMTQKPATAVVDPKDKLAGFGSDYLAGYYYTLFDAKNKKALEKAVNNYFEDFENKALIRKSSKTKKAYGKIQTTIRWGTFKNSTPSYGTTNVLLGYEFVEKSPYFTITIQECENEYYKTTTTVNRTSSIVKYYFTKAQIKSLLNYISDDSISSYFSDYDEKQNEGNGDEY